MSDRRIMRSKPRAVRRSVGWRSCEDDETTDTSQSDHNNGSSSPPASGITTRQKKYGRCNTGGYCSDSHSPHRLAPMGVFWDIENCQIPRGRSAVAVAKVIRDKFLHGYREAEFLVVCDVKKEPSQVIQELNDAQVNLIHVGSQCKNAADEKLRQSIRRFADLHGSSAAIVLISGDINFAPDLCDLRHRKKIHVILVHNDVCSESLILCADEHYRFSALIADLPLRGAVKGANQPAEVTVSALPPHSDPGKVRARLKRLAENCGGRVGVIFGEIATVRFPSIEFAIRAQKRMDGENVFGSQIIVSYPILVTDDRPFNDVSPMKSYNRKVNGKRDEERHSYSFSNDQRNCWNNPSTNGVNGFCIRRPKLSSSAPYYNQENIPNHGWRIGFQNLQHHHNQQLPSERSKLRRQSEMTNVNNLKGYQENSGRHSLDSMLDFEGEKEDNRSDGRSTSTFDYWLRNGGQESRKCRTPSPKSILDINTSIPPPPIVNLPRRDDSSKYFFHPIQTLNSQNQHSSTSPVSSNENTEVLRCLLHSKPNSPDSSLLNITASLSEFSARITALVTSHNNKLLLSSLKDCYEAQFGFLTSDFQSVPLEHLVSCASSVELVTDANGKYLRLARNISPIFSDPPSYDGLLSQFSQEITELLKAQPKCLLSFDRIIPGYRQFYGRQCRISDFGCSKLIELLEKIGQTVQVMGEGSSRVVTLTHRAQMQRFTSDLTRVLRSQASKQLPVSSLSQQWFKILGRNLEPTSYGLCYLEDLLDRIPSNIATVNKEIVSLSRKLHQTVEEKIKTEKFAQQVVELLSTAPQFSMEFSKFIPAFHQYFGTQCKMTDFGFTKLIELFEAIPHVVKVEGEMERGRRITLTVSEKLKILSEQILSLVQLRFPPGLYLDALMSAYLWQFGNALRPSVLQCVSLAELVNKLPSVKIVNNAEGSAMIVPSTNKSDSSINPDTVKTDVKEPGNSQLDSPEKDKTSCCEQLQSTQQDVQINYVSLDSIPKDIKINLIETKPFGYQTSRDKETEITLLTPSEILLPRSVPKFPSSPDPSQLPLPVGFTLNQISNEYENLGCKLLDDLDPSDLSKRKQRLKLAPQFCSPLQLN